MNERTEGNFLGFFPSETLEHWKRQAKYAQASVPSDSNEKRPMRLSAELSYNHAPEATLGPRPQEGPDKRIQHHPTSLNPILLYDVE